MRSWSFVLLAVAGCAYEPIDPASSRAPSGPPARDEAVARPGGVDGPTWRKHTCARSVLSGYGGVDSDEPIVEEPPSASDGGTVREAGEDPANPESVGGDYTLDEKLAAINKRRKNGGSCDTRHRDALETAILRRAAPKPATSSARARATGSFEHAQLVGSVLALTADEEKRLARDGVVVSERLEYDNYTTAYYDIHRGQLPVYVTADSILHAIYASHATYLGTLEESQLAVRLDEVLGAMHCGLPAAAKNYAPEIADDIDLYLTVARSLLAGQPVLSELGHVDKRAAELVELVTNPSTTVAIDLFGRQRGLDTTQFTPRGHYDQGGWGRLESYFRAAMWLSRVDLNLVSRDTRASTPGYHLDPRETPREAVVAVALADLAERTGAVKGIEVLDRAWATLAGTREDVSITQLLALRRQAKLTGTLEADDAKALRDAIGDGFRRTVNVGPTPNVKNLPVIATMLGARITPDTVALGKLIEERGPEASAVELGYMLGNDRARAHIAGPLASQVTKARELLAKATLGPDLYASWLTAVRALATTPAGAKPRFMETDAFADLRLNTMLTAYGQLRHNHVLISAQAYDQGGCEIPDGYVEPAPATYLALAEYARRGAATFRSLDPRGGKAAIAYFARVEKLMKVLAQISREELAGKPPSAEARRFLSMIVERRVANAMGYGGSFPVATFDGWYLDLFPNIDTGLETPMFIADFATFDRNGKRGIHYVGAKNPRLGVFVVDTGGSPRLMVGPVARGFQHTGPHEARLDDDSVRALAVDEPWAASYTVGATTVPAYSLWFRRPGAGKGRLGTMPDAPAPNVVRIESKQAHGEATVELLDHHFQKLGEVALTIVAGRSEATVPALPRPVEALRVRVNGSAERFDVSLAGEVRRSSRGEP